MLSSINSWTILETTTRKLHGTRGQERLMRSSELFRKRKSIVSLRGRRRTCMYVLVVLFKKKFHRSKRKPKLRRNSDSTPHTWSRSPISTGRVFASPIKQSFIPGNIFERWSGKSLAMGPMFLKEAQQLSSMQKSVGQKLTVTG